MSNNAVRPFSQGFSQDISQMDEQLKSYTIEECDAGQTQQSVISQPDLTEEQIYTRANSICEENRQIRTYVESSLKQLEKRRQKVVDKKNSLDEQLKQLSQIHERQKQESLELQMSHEEITQQFQNELQRRPQLAEKMDRTLAVVSLFESHFAKGSSVGLEIEKAEMNISLKFKECHEKSQSVNIKKLNLSFKTEMEDKIRKCKKIREEIMMARESNLREIQDLTNQNMEKSKKVNDIQDNINHFLYKDQKLTTTFNDMAVQNKTLNEEIFKIQQELHEVRAVGNSHIQNLKLRINTKEINNSNLEVKSREREHSINSSLTKLKELKNLSSQLQSANEVTEMRNLDLEKQINETSKQNYALTDEIRSLQEEITCKSDNVQNLNKSYKNKIHELEEIMKKSEIVIKVKEDSVTNLSNHFESLKERLFSLEHEVDEISEDLELSTCAKEEMAATVLRNKLLYEDERKSKLLRNETLANKNSDLSLEMNKLSKDVEDMKKTTNRLKAEEKDMIALIKKNKDTALSNDEKLTVKEKELEEMSSEFTERFSSKYRELDKYEELLNLAKPTLDELPSITARKTYLEQAICEQQEKYHKDMEMAENNCNTKIIEMDKEIENYRSIMKGLLEAEVEATEKIKEDIRGTEKMKLNLEDDVNNAIKQLNTLKADVANKRNKVAKVEKRLRAINNEVKVTRQDISDAVSGKVKEATQTKTVFKSSHKLMTPTSSLDSLKKHQNEPPPDKKVPSDFDSKLYTQVNTRKWIESVPDDEYEFSEI